VPERQRGDLTDSSLSLGLGLSIERCDLDDLFRFGNRLLTVLP
jgi:hypothetical protein